VRIRFLKKQVVVERLSVQSFLNLFVVDVRPACLARTDSDTLIHRHVPLFSPQFSEVVLSPVTQGERFVTAIFAT
jgi:hypothetical protein